jgi:predicted O-methyltransferase YrrM
MVFTSDWFSHNAPLWDAVIPKTPGQKILEIGSYEGRSCIWFCEKISDSTITCIDTFEGSDEHYDDMKDGLYDRFRENTLEFKDRITVLQGYSDKVLRKLEPVEQYDVAYIDGSHYTRDVLADAVLTFPLVKSGGLIIFDDYEWPGYVGTLANPKTGINAFVACYKDKLEVVSVAYQLIVKKK